MNDRSQMGVIIAKTLVNKWESHTIQGAFAIKWYLFYLDFWLRLGFPKTWNYIHRYRQDRFWYFLLNFFKIRPKLRSINGQSYSVEVLRVRSK